MPSPPCAREIRASVAVGVLGFRPTLAEPAQLPQPPPLFLSLHLVARHLLFLLHKRIGARVLRAAARGRARSRGRRALQARARRRIRGAALLRLEDVLDDGCLSLQNYAAVVNVPDFRAWIYGLTPTPEETAQITYIAMKRIRGCVR